MAFQCSICTIDSNKLATIWYVVELASPRSHIYKRCSIAKTIDNEKNFLRKLSKLKKMTQNMFERILKINIHFDVFLTGLRACFISFGCMKKIVDNGVTAHVVPQTCILLLFFAKVTENYYRAQQ